MKLLIVTQKVNKEDPILGFFHNWIAEFAARFESVLVICLEEGAHELPANVRVLSLGKDRGTNNDLRLKTTREHGERSSGPMTIDEESRVNRESNIVIRFVSKLKYAAQFYTFIIRERNNYNTVLVHMNPIYVVLGGPVWKILGKKISLWYTHKSVDMKLRIAELFANKIFTASKESFRLPSVKVQVVGHGIDIDIFSPLIQPASRGEIVSVGRISRTKNQMAMIQGLAQAISNGYTGTLRIVGGPVTDDDSAYENELKMYVQARGLEKQVFFVGSIRPDEVVNVYHAADIFLNLSSTGSLDKAVLEALACGLKVLTSNEAFVSILPPEYVTNGTPHDIALKLSVLAKREVESRWREYVVKEHSLKRLIGHLTQELL